MNIYVGNLSYDCTDEVLKEMFVEFGEVTSASVIMDRNTGRSRGFGFIEMADDEQGQAAVDAVNGKEIDGRTLKVSEARPRTERPQRDRY